jgi:hypothetical protein
MVLVMTEVVFSRMYSAIHCDSGTYHDTSDNSDCRNRSDSGDSSDSDNSGGPVRIV